MGGYFDSIDRFAIGLARFVLRWRWLVIAAAIALTAAIGSGAQRLEFANNFRIFFSAENPELQAFENLQATYTKNDNFLFVFEPANGDVFSVETLTAVKKLTEAAWQIPYATRVDSLTNFQHTEGIDDDLIVQDLVSDPTTLDPAGLQRVRTIALEEPLLRELAVSSDSAVTVVSVVLQYPERDLQEVPSAVAYARQLRDQVLEENPRMELHLTGASMMNNAFAETGVEDMSTLVPLMFGVIVVLTFLILKSFAATIATVFVIIFSVVAGMGAAGWLGINLSPVSASAPIVILTLAIADSIHVLVSLRSALREGLEKHAAIIEAMRLNFIPITITSLTTVIGFMSLNFSDSPPFGHLGNITAIGISAAWLFSITLLPALMSVFPVRTRRSNEKDLPQRAMAGLSEFVIGNHRALLIIVGSAVLVLVAFIPKLQLNDQWVQYFSKETQFRIDSDRTLERLGMYTIHYSVPAAEPGGINEPSYLLNLEAFAEFMRTLPGVVHVYSISDVIKRLNKNLHGDDPDWYRIPENRELSAQYLLLYELSLPYGLDLNDRIDVDKSASRLTITLKDIDSPTTKQILAGADAWWIENAPDMRAPPTSPHIMFTYIAERNVRSMVGGTLLAIVSIAVILILALRSIGLGLLSLVPNGLPILTTFGVWALINGDVGFAIAGVASISLGIVVDDTVHLLSKYVRARRERRLTPEDAIRHAFSSVGVAIVVNTVILAAGFVVLTFSNFKVNAEMGLLTSIAIVTALVLDFLLLPPLLLCKRERVKTPAATPASSAEALPAEAG